MSINCKLVALVLALVLSDEAHSANIFGGQEAKPHSRPYMVYVVGHRENGVSMYCGGFLLNEDFVMTAAHCQAHFYTAFLGVHNVRETIGIQNISVEQAFPHKNYDQNNYMNDIMLLKLSSKAHFDINVKPIPLPDRGDGSLPTSCSIAGWGNTDKHPNNRSPVLMEVNVTLFVDDNCPKENSYCSTGRNGPGPGDSGGPLVCEDGKAYGVVSSGFISGPDNMYTYSYARIVDYSAWINFTFKRSQAAQVFTKRDI